MSSKLFIPENKESRREIIADTVFDIQSFVCDDMCAGEKPLLSKSVALSYVQVLSRHVKDLDHYLWGRRRGGRNGILRDGYQREEWDDFVLVIAAWLKSLEKKVAVSLSNKEFEMISWRKLLFSPENVTKIARELGRILIEKKIVDMRDEDLARSIVASFASDEDADAISKTIDAWSEAGGSSSSCLSFICSGNGSVDTITQFKQRAVNQMLVAKDDALVTILETNEELDNMAT